MPVFWRAMTGFLMQPQICRLSVRYLTPFACSAHFPPADKSLWTTPRTPCTAQRNAATVCTAQRNENSARFDYGEATSPSERTLPDIQVPSEYTYKYYATCAPGLEELVAAELSSPLIGARDVEVGSSGVGFSGPLATGYRQAYALSQVLHLLQYCTAANENECVTSGALNLLSRAGARSPLRVHYECNSNEKSVYFSSSDHPSACNQVRFPTFSNIQLPRIDSLPCKNESCMERKRAFVP